MSKLVAMKVAKKRGRPRKNSLGKTTKLRSELGSKWLACDQCSIEEMLVDKDVSSVTCARCVQGTVAPPPEPKQPLSPEEKALRAQRRIERRARQAAIAAGKIPGPAKDLGFGRGWHRKKLFATEVDGKNRFFSLGKELTEKEFKALEKDVAKAAKAKEAKKSGFPRGWHFMKEYIHTNGDVYRRGKLVRKKK